MQPHILVIGGENHNLRIPFLLELKKIGFRVTAAGTGHLAPFAEEKIDYYPYDFDRFVNPLADLKTVRALSKLIADAQPDVVQTFDTKPNVLVPLAAKMVGNVQVVRTINGLGWVYSSRSLSALALRPIFRALHKLTSPWTASTVFQNRDDQAFFEQNKMIGRGDNQLIPGSGVEIEKFEQAASDGPVVSELRQALGLGDSEVVITVTRLARSKGIPVLLEAAALVHERRRNVRFLLVGSLQSEGKLAVLQAEIDRHAPYVMAIGPRSDVPSLLSLADVFAFPTELREGIPRVLLEAAIAGLPIVTTTMPGCVDVVQDGFSGFLVPPGKPRLLADRIVDLLQDRQNAKAMAAHARTWVKEEFSLNITADRYAAIYWALAGRNSMSQPEKSTKLNHMSQNAT